MRNTSNSGIGSMLTRIIALSVLGKPSIGRLKKGCWKNHRQMIRVRNLRPKWRKPCAPKCRQIPKVAVIG